jgi:hypothetical protein
MNKPGLLRISKTEKGFLTGTSQIQGHRKEVDVYPKCGDLDYNPLLRVYPPLDSQEQMGNGDSDWEARVVEPQIGRCHSKPPFCSPHLILPLVILPCLSPSDRRRRKHQQQHSKNTQGKPPSLEVSCTTTTTTTNKKLGNCVVAAV